MNAHRQESRTYDSLDCHTAVSDALGQAAQYQYNARNLLSRHRDRMNRATDYSYDVQGRLTTIAHPDGDTLRLTYDAVGRIQSIEDNTSRIDYRYDAADRLIRERTTNAAGSHEVAYTWDNLDRLIRRTVNGTDPTDYRYDLAGRLIEIEYRGSLTTYLWDAADRLVARTLPNGIHQSYSWDAASRLTHIEYRDAEDQLIEAIAYEYDAKGQRTRKTGGPGSAPETPFEAEYDAADRMTQITLYPGTEDEATYNLEYDAEGNLTRKQNLDDSSDTTDYTWDVRNRLIAITSPDITANFKYDAINRRIERTLNGQTLRAIYDGPQLIGEIAGGLIDPTYLTGLQIDEMIARHTAAGARTYLTDALGSVIAQTTDDQTPINWYAYSPYGEVDIIGNDEGNPVQYTGRENDRTGLYYYRARYYDPVLKRFIARDPIGLAAGVNFYAYVLGDPISNIDPLGLDVTVCYFPKAANRLGHVGLGVNTDTTVGYYPHPGNSDLQRLRGPGAVRPDDHNQPTQCTTVETTDAQDRIIQDFIDEREGNPGNYGLLTRNCSRFVAEALNEAGIPVNSVSLPASVYSGVVNHNSGKRKTRRGTR